MNCDNCGFKIQPIWSFCPACGVQLSEGISNANTNASSTKERQIAERFLLLANDYKALTGHTLEGEVLKSFIAHPACARLSIVDGHRRLKAGRQCRKSLGSGKFSLDLDSWIEQVYEVNESRSISRVWISEGGNKYHVSRDCTGMRGGQEYARWRGKDTYNPQYVPIRQAAHVLGLTPCLVCKPPSFT